MKLHRIAIYHNLHSGGAKRVVMEQARNLAVKYQVTLYSLECADHRFANGDTEPSIPTVIHPFQPIEYLPSPWGRLNPLLGLYNIHRLDRAAYKMAQQIDAEKYDVVLVHPCQFTQAPLVLRWLHTPTLYYCHELPRRLYEPTELRPTHHSKRLRQQLREQIDKIDLLARAASPILRQIDRHCATHATQIVVNSRLTQANVWEAYQRKATVCYPGVNANNFYRPSLAPSIDRQSFVLSVGALTPNKGFDLIIRALATIPVAQRPALVLVSNYQERAEHTYLVELAAGLGVQLTVYCNLPDAEVYALYGKAGCVAYAPVREPLGLVALEAMAAGTPVVGIDEGGVRETIVDGVTGLLAPRDPCQFGQSIQRILQEPQLAAQLSQAARLQVLQHWTWACHMAVLEQLLLQTATHPGQLI